MTDLEAIRREEMLLRRRSPRRPPTTIVTKDDIYFIPLKPVHEFVKWALGKNIKYIVMGQMPNGGTMLLGTQRMHEREKR